ncbi:MAG: aminotransferase class IV [Deltaproteobacteria bacterium]|jgi:branched-chain amino acid aminotransferase|nr:aminotransferase class IV [Deltaproteobacteria bacterium]
MKTWPCYSPEELLKRSLELKREWHENYFVMYSSVWNGFSTNPELWGVPADDHMVHRADGVFEAFKCVKGRVYCLNEHLERLRRSAAALSLKLPPVLDDVLDVLKQAYVLGGKRDFQGRICVSRGPGSFSVNPYESKGPELYLVTLRLKKIPRETILQGVTMATSPFPAKTEFAGVKSVDYLHNALARKAALDLGAEYAASFDREGCLTEGPTENIVVVTKDGELVVPEWKRILKGITLGRVLERAGELIEKGLLKSAGNRDLRREELPGIAQEVFLTATTYDVLPVRSWDGAPVGSGKSGPVALEFARLLEEEALSDNPHTVSLES